MTHSHQTINFVSIRRRFDFRSIEMGRWVTPDERDRAAVKFHQALEDLMAILQGPEHLISLRGTLGLQYGKGGRPGVAAHYMPATRQLSLAKNAGAGALAHEWFHAYDHFICEKMFVDQPSSYFASRCWIDSAPMYLSKNSQPHPLNQLLANCFRTVLLSEDGDKPSNLFLSSQQADQRLNILYYAKPEEMCARAFEAFVEDAAPASPFLVKGTRFSEEAKAGLYPHGDQRLRINSAFERYFSSLGSALYRELA
ncbi:CLCA_X family protein [Marinomonas vulgaris]|uniref:CLCA_X family protein n=1 Tax=Marinomonas vulgaris TaxID=2823372 RepID=UPI0038B3CB3B